MRPGLALALVLFPLTLACADSSSHHPARGIVRGVHADLGQVVIEHEEISGLMPAMTMNFDVPDAALLASFEKGQRIEFTVEFTGRAYRVVEARAIGSSGPGEAPAFADLAAERDPAPAFDLLDQSERRVSLASLRGKVVLLDFVYTECPGPCPIQTSSHVSLQRSFPVALRELVWFVSISLDPARDTPEALQRYAEARGADLRRWSFLTGPPAEVADVVKRFGVGSLRREDGEIDHLLVTFLIDAEGRIAERYVGLDHDRDELRRDLERISSR